MAKNYFFLFFIIINIFSKKNSKKIVIPFKTVHNTNENYIKSLLQYQLYTEMEIGTTKQKVNIAISTDTSLFNIESFLLNETFYSHNKSNSYKNNSYMFLYLEYQRIKYGDILNETFYFQDSLNSNKKPFQNITFNYITELSKGYSGQDNGYIDNNINLISGVIGLQITRKYNERDNIFLIKSLKNTNAIDKIIWNINYKNDNEGYLIFGEYPHQYNNSFKESNIKKINCITISYDFYWYFIFTDIRIGQNKIKLSRTADYAPQIGVVIGTNEYGTLISSFFNNSTRVNKCVLKEIDFKKEIYKYYECDNDTYINDFETLVFIHQELSYNFTLDKNDLFVNYNNKKYFLIVFKKKISYEEKWVLGKPFIRKYNFVFDHDNKIILFYDNKVKEKENENLYQILKYIFIIILGILVLILGIFIGKKLFGKKKKKKANELEDSINDDQNINSINTNNTENSDYNKMGF